jgi:hypothetical protein
MRTQNVSAADAFTALRGTLGFFGLISLVALGKSLLALWRTFRP